MEAEAERRMGAPMTDEECRKLCEILRLHLSPYAKQAADEIERLAAIIHDYNLTFGDIHDVSMRKSDEAALAQSNAEPNVPPLRYSDKVEKSPDGTETRCLEIAQPDTEPANYIPIGGAGNGA
jgi:hypothetical protein